MEIFTEDHLHICKRGREEERKREREREVTETERLRGMVDLEKKDCVRCEVRRKVCKICWRKECKRWDTNGKVIEEERRGVYILLANKIHYTCSPEIYHY